MIKAIFFDLDNTLYPTFHQASVCRQNSIDEIIRTMYDMGIKQEKIPIREDAISDLKEIVEQTGSNAKNHFDLLLRRYGINGNKLILLREVGKNEYYKNKFNKVKPWPDVETTLRNLEKSYLLGIITNGLTDKQLSKIHLLHLVKYFKLDQIIIEEDVGYSKPNKKIFEHAASKVGLDSKDCVYVGDKPREDIFGAFNAGFIPILFKNGPYSDDTSCLREMKENEDYYVIKHFSELIDLIPNIK